MLIERPPTAGAKEYGVAVEIVKPLANRQPFAHLRHGN